MACNRKLPCDHCIEGISSRPFSPRTWGLNGLNGLLRRPLRRTSPPRSSPPCEVRPASGSQDLNIRPAPKFESDTALVDSTRPNSPSNSSEGSTTFEAVKKQKVANNPSEKNCVIIAILEPTTTRTIASTNEEIYENEFKFIPEMKCSKLSSYDV